MENNQIDFQKMFEYLIPIIFFIIWIITKLFASKEKESEQDPEPSPLSEQESQELDSQQEVYREEDSVGSEPVTVPYQEEHKPFDYMGELEKQRKKLLSMAEYTEVPVKVQPKVREVAYIEEVHSFQGMDLRASLSHHKMAQKAFILHEVLNAPISMRKNETWH